MDLRQFNERLAKYEAKLKDLRTNPRRLPTIVGINLQNFYRKAFNEGGFYDNGFHPWQTTLRQSFGSGASSRYKPLGSGKRRLFGSIRFVPGSGFVKLVSALPYSAIHNEGGETHPMVTKKMRGYMWYMYYKSTTKRQRKKGEVSEIASMYKGIALTKKETLTVKIPKRQFLYDAPEVKQLVRGTIKNEILKIIL